MKVLCAQSTPCRVPSPLHVFATLDLPSTLHPKTPHVTLSFSPMFPPKLRLAAKVGVMYPLGSKGPSLGGAG